MPRPPLALCRLVLVALAIVAAPIGSVSAQVPQTPPGGTLGINPGQVLRNRPALSNNLVLEGAVDPQEYIVGPGDEFSISIGGVVPRQFTASVTADGILVIPEAGSFAAVGRTLAAVRGEARAALQRRFSNVTTDVALASPRQFYVHVSGAVPDPGRHVVRSVARVEDALTVASGDRPPRDLGRYQTPVARTSRWPALRNVIVTHGTGSEDRVDLMRYFATGDVAHNPYLRDGDAVRLPTFSPAQEGVSVNGAISRPGVYDVRADDTVLNLLVAAGWTNDTPGTSASGIRLTSVDGAVRTLSLDEAARTPVGPRDQISVVEADPEAGYATTVGAVRYPGVYPIRSGHTTLRQLLEMAGGLREGALVRGAYLLRPARTTADTTDTTRAAPLGDLDFLSRRFLEQELGRTATVAVDIERAIQGLDEVVLQDGDRLVVPRGSDGVRVLGQVLRPGYVPFAPGQTVSDYVEAAGGVGPGSTEVYLVEAGSGQLIADARREVREGDGVFVARVPTADNIQTAQIRMQELQAEREDRRDARQARYQFVSTVLGVAGTLASILLSIAALSQ